MDPFFPGWMVFMMKMLVSKSEFLKSTPMEASITWTRNGFMSKNYFPIIFFIEADEKKFMTKIIEILKEMPKRPVPPSDPIAGIENANTQQPPKKGAVNAQTENSKDEAENSLISKSGNPQNSTTERAMEVENESIGTASKEMNANELEEDEEFDFSVASEEDIENAFGEGRKELKEDMINLQILDWKMFKTPLLFIINTLKKFVPEFPMDEQSIMEIRRFQDDIISIPNNITFQRVAADLINLKCEKFATVERKSLPDFIMFVQIFTGEKEPAPGYALKYATGIMGILQKWVKDAGVDAEIATGGLRKAKPFVMIGFKDHMTALKASESKASISHILNNDLWIVINKASMICRARKGWSRLIVSNVSLDTDKAVNVVKTIINFNANHKGIAMISQISKANNGTKSRSVIVLARTKIVEWAKESINKNEKLIGVGTKGVEVKMKATVAKEKSSGATEGVG